MATTGPEVGDSAASDLAFTCLLPVWGDDDPANFELALESVVGNTVRPSAVFICEDGPLPASLERAAAQAARAHGARRIRNGGPRGLHHNLNHALAAVETPWCCRADADDINLSDRFEAQTAFLRVHRDVAVAGGAIEEFFPDGRTRRKAVPTAHEDIVRQACWRNPINHMTAFIRLDALRDCGGYPAIPRKEDYGLWLTMIARGYRLANLDKVLVRARLGDFHHRRAGLANLASECALFRLKRSIPGIGLGRAAGASAVRALALMTTTGANLVYETWLRRESEG